ncbi:ATP-binding cassette domain-containing protein [Burkholderia sp. Bp8963]|uniref:AAA family ATPase n=1 Tax=Burkholderia sp. Bp8963 TaxID=2184547 RepID=UPI000F59C62C|nr:AAA family ATPase [Burkholderia sp. Bp8963]RQS76197.1 ATP-binding cassette domain-containing protein [Burkholderia sp. Bp8963]
MLFTVVQYKDVPRKARSLAGTDECYLLRDNWDDYLFKTTFRLVYFDSEGTRHDIGSVKVMSDGMEEGWVSVEDSFSELPQDYASLGGSAEYYENLISLDEEERIVILRAMRDVIWDADIRARVEQEPAFQTSLMRGHGRDDIEKMSDILLERTTSTAFRFSYSLSANSDARLRVNVEPDSNPPTNIHAIIGRNGVGKTTLLRLLVQTLRDGSTARGGELQMRKPSGSTERTSFANLVAVAFSAFDEFDPPVSNKGTGTGIRYTYVGLKKERRKDGEASSLKRTSELKKEFVDSTLACLRSARVPRWRAAMRVLETDPLFAALGLVKLADLEQNRFAQEAGELFDRASSGHKVVLLTMTKLVELVTERTLVVIDEPEAHLHPPLVAAFVRALSNLLAVRNGVALLATHSPVVVQEIPAACVTLFFRTGDEVELERPEAETFAENLGTLTREIFRVEMTESSHHALISKVVAQSRDFEQVLAVFNDQLGAEGRSVARSLLRGRDA